LIAVAALVAANLIPLVGVFAWGWDAFNIVLLYWIENVIVGAINVLKILLAAQVAEDTGATANDTSKAFLVPFFIVHYGIFMLVHGIFLFALFGNTDAPRIGHVFAGVGGWAVLALLASHLVSFVGNYVVGGERLRTTPKDQLFAPYGRVVVMHLVILVGAVGVQASGSPLVLLVLLVVGKTVLDVWFHLRERSRRA